MRLPLVSELEPSLGGLSSRDFSTQLVVNLTQSRAWVRYATTDYGAMIQWASVMTNVEAQFQMLPCTASRVVSSKGHFSKLWMHPVDIPLLYKYEGLRGLRGEGVSEGVRGSVRGLVRG